MPQTTLRFDDKLFAELEAARGEIPRERFIRRVLSDYLRGVREMRASAQTLHKGDWPDVSLGDHPTKGSDVED